MAENKTKPTEAGVEAYLDAIADETRRQDCHELARLMTRVSGHQPKMWGPSIVGFGSYHYKYESGREGEFCLSGFASRKRDISIYLMAYFDGHAKFLEQLGKHKMGKSCLSVRRLSDVRLDVLEQLIAGSIAAIKRRYP